MKRSIYIFLLAIGIGYTSFSQSTTTYRNEQGNVIGTATKDEYRTTYKNSQGNIIGTSTTQQSVYSQYQPVGSGAAQVLPRTNYSWMEAAASISRENIKIANNFYDEAYNLMNNKRYDEALYNLKQAEGYYSRTMLNKNDLSKFNLTVAICYMKLNDKYSTIKYLGKLGNPIKKHRDYMPTIGFLYYSFKEFKLAEKFYKKAIRIDRHSNNYDIDLYEKLLEIYTESGNNKKAQKIKAKIGKY